MAINTILFDLDGTIADTLPLIRKTYFKVFEEMNIPWGDDDVMKMIGLPLREIGRLMAGMGKEEEFYDTYQKHYSVLHHDFISVFPGIEKILSVLSEKAFTLGIVTSKGKKGANLTLSSMKLSDYFSIIVTVEHTMNHKPNPDPVYYALEKLGKRPDEAVYIGDSPFDIMAGNSAGVTTIAVTWGMANVEGLLKHNPNYCVDSREKLLDLILSLAD